MQQQVGHELSGEVGVCLEKQYAHRNYYNAIESTASVGTVALQGCHATLGKETDTSLDNARLALGARSRTPRQPHHPDDRLGLAEIVLWKWAKKGTIRSCNNT